MAAILSRPQCVDMQPWACNLPYFCGHFFPRSWWRHSMETHFALLMFSSMGIYRSPQKGISYDSSSIWGVGAIVCVYVVSHWRKSFLHYHIQYIGNESSESTYLRRGIPQHTIYRKGIRMLTIYCRGTLTQITHLRGSPGRYIYRRGARKCIIYSR